MYRNALKIIEVFTVMRNFYTGKYTCTLEMLLRFERFMFRKT